MDFALSEEQQAALAVNSEHYIANGARFNATLQEQP